MTRSRPPGSGSGGGRSGGGRSGKGRGSRRPRPPGGASRGPGQGSSPGRRPPRKGGKPPHRRGAGPSSNRPLRTGDRTPSREIVFPFEPGPVPEVYQEAVSDLVLFCEDLGLTLPEEAESKLARYCQRLTEANEVMNLTRGTSSPAELVSRHIGDCLVFRACLGSTPQGKLLDVGTGAGLPAIPLAIACPDLEVVALDSRAKKIAFLEAMVQELDLPNLRPRAERAEVLGHDPAFRGRFQAVVSRATANLPVLLELTLPFLEGEGFLFASKGSRVEEEVESSRHALRELASQVVSVESYPTMDPEVSFAMVVVQRVGPMDGKFPRHPSQIKSRPLGLLSV